MDETSELAGLTLPKHLDGRSFKLLLDDPKAKHKEAAISQFPRRREGAQFQYMGHAMRTDRYRYIEWFDRKTGEITARELYDHQHDAAENENIAIRPENADLLSKLNSQLWQTIPRPNSGK